MNFDETCVMLLKTLNWLTPSHEQVDQNIWPLRSKDTNNLTVEMYALYKHPEKYWLVEEM